MATKERKTKKHKGVEASAVLKAIGVDNDVQILTIGEGENRVEVIVKKRLSLGERADMVDSIASMVCSQNESGDFFAPYLRKFAYDFNVLNYFTNIKLPDDMNKVWELVDGTDIAARVIDALGRNTCVQSIIHEANELIEHRKNALLKKTKVDTLLDTVIDIAHGVKSSTDGLDTAGIVELAQQYAPELKDKLKELLHQQVAEVHESATEPEAPAN